MTDIEIAAEAAKTAADNASKEASAKAVAEVAAKATAAQAAADANLVRMTPAQLKERLDESRVAGEKALAAQLGVPVEEAKKLIADAKARDDANKSEVQRLTEQLAAAQAKSARLGVLEETVTGRAAVEFGALSDVQKAAVETIAGSDPAARLKTIDALKPSWAAAQKVADDTAQVAKAAADAAAEAAKKAPVPAGATTAPASPPPPPAQPGTPTNHLAVWESLKASNPVAAGMYRSKHDAAIRAAQRQATG